MSASPSAPPAMTASSIDSPPAPPSIPYLLLLPVELRLQIYASLLIATHTSSLATRRTTLSSLDIHPAILLVCTLLHREATPVLYSQNTFHAHPSLLTTFPRLLPNLAPIRSPSLLPLIRRVHLTVRLDLLEPSFCAAAAAASLSGLEELTVELAQGGVFLGAGCQNLRALEDVRGVARVSFRGSTLGFEAYLAWLRGVMMAESGSVRGGFVAVEECSWVDRFVKVNQLVVV